MENDTLILSIIKAGAERAFQLSDGMLAFAILNHIPEFRGRLTDAEIAAIAPASEAMVLEFLKMQESKQ